MIISDTNIIASFAAAESIPRLLAGLSVQSLHLTPAVRSELKAGAIRGHSHLATTEKLITSGTLQMLELTDEDRARMPTLPPSFGSGEREVVAAAVRLSAVVLSNDRVVTYCRQERIVCFDLNTLLRRLWVKSVASKGEVRAMMKRMSSVEGMVFKDPDSIFAPARTR